jgi:hypothetical protein
MNLCGRISMRQNLERKRFVATDQFEIGPIERKQVRSDVASAQRQKDIVQHLLDFRFPTGLLPRYSRYDLARLFPVRKAGSDHTAGSFKSSDVSFDQTNGLNVKRSCVKFLNDDASEVSLEDQRKELALK